jgi:hypothetical protein
MYGDSIKNIAYIIHVCLSKEKIINNQSKYAASAARRLFGLGPGPTNSKGKNKIPHLKPQNCAAHRDSS